MIGSVPAAAATRTEGARHAMAEPQRVASGRVAHVVVPRARNRHLRGCGGRGSRASCGGWGAAGRW
eukprot:3480087-Pleurochrysis_carterae.AAC.1